MASFEQRHPLGVIITKGSGPPGCQAKDRPTVHRIRKHANGSRVPFFPIYLMFLLEILRSSDCYLACFFFFCFVEFRNAIIPSPTVAGASDQMAVHLDWADEIFGGRMNVGILFLCPFLRLMIPTSRSTLAYLDRNRYCARSPLAWRASVS